MADVDTSAHDETLITAVVANAIANKIEELDMGATYDQHIAGFNLAIAEAAALVRAIANNTRPPSKPTTNKGME